MGQNILVKGSYPFYNSTILTDILIFFLTPVFHVFRLFVTANAKYRDFKDLQNNVFSFY